MDFSVVYQAGALLSLETATTRRERFAPWRPIRWVPHEHTSATTSYTTTGVNLMPNVTTTATASTGAIYIINNGAVTATHTNWVVADTMWANWNTGYEKVVESRAQKEAREKAQREAEARRHRIEAEERQRREAERRRTEELRRQQEEQNRRIEAELAAAEAVAKQLLYCFLSDQEIATFEQHGYIDVTAKDGSGVYRIRKGWAGNIDRLDAKGKPVERLCVHPKGNKIPDHDNVFLQRFLLLNDPGKLLPLANRTPLIQ